MHENIGCVRKIGDMYCIGEERTGHGAQLAEHPNRWFGTSFQPEEGRYKDEH